MNGLVRLASIAALIGATGIAAQAGEAPMLAEMVAAGTLPRLEERLPANPLVMTPTNEIGTYGGTIARGHGILFDVVFINMTREPLIGFHAPHPGEAPPEPNLAESWSFNDAGTELTLNLRQGIKWSDGAPFTAEDVMFYWNDILLDPEVSVSPPPSLYAASGVLPVAEMVDAHTIKLTYPFPYKRAEEALAAVPGIFAWAKHDLSEHHPRYNSAASYDDINAFAEPWSDRGRVTLGAWMLEDVSADSQRFTFVRNPYYWKVDTEGNQLPYIDRVVNVIVPDRQQIAVGNITGEYDYDGMWVGNQHLPLFLDEQDERDFQIGYHANTPGMAIHFNYDNADANVREMVRNVNFRRAFSVAVNRPALNRLFFLDLMEPSGWTFSPNSPYYDDETGKLYSEYDPEKANALLDEAGFVDTNGDGIRELPNGTPLSLVVDVANHDLYVPIVEYLADTFPGEVGIELVMNNQQQDLIQQRRTTPDWQLHVWDIYGSSFPLAKPEDWVPVSAGFPFWHQNAINETFSPEYQEFADILLNAAALDYDERVAEMRRANRIQAENVFNIHLGYYKRAYIYANRLGNMIENSPVRDVSTGLLEGPMRLPQIYIKQ